MELEDNYNLLQTHVISVLREYPRFLTILKAIYPRFDNLQEVANFLSEALYIDKAEDTWLDYIGWLVGTTRDYFAGGKFFCVNAPDLNEEKYFWFRTSKIDPNSKLKDVLFRRRIYGKIGYNVTKGTREENIFIIKNMTFADKVIIRIVEPMVMDITLYGDEIIDSATMRADIETILGNGIGIRNLQVKGLNEYGN